MKKLFNKANIIMFIKFAFVGVINTLIDAGVFYILCDISGINEIVSNTAAYLVSATNSYLMNSKGVYHEEKYSFSKYVKFLIGNTSVLIISTLSLIALSGVIKTNIIKKLVTVPITAVLNFIFQRFILFKNSADKIN
ncbi:MAG: GtrA family protein [Clostridia bacterium]|nr:GtrA family protein [Clostridia bacterium]